jgi:hypothetical protein
VVIVDKTKMVNIRNVKVKDWKIITETTEALGIKMADMIHFLAVILKRKESDINDLQGLRRRILEEI